VIEFTRDSGDMRTPWVVGVSGASGTPYAAAVIRGLVAAGEAIDLVVSRAARLTILDETGVSFRDHSWREDLASWLGWSSTPSGSTTSGNPADLHYWAVEDLAAGPSSGSYPVRGMIVVPASAACCAGVALGLSKDLLQRAAQVNLKERRPVVIVPRETPATRGHLLDLVTLHDSGAVVLPASPGFYGAGAAATADQLVDFIAGKVLDSVGVEHSLFTRWAGAVGRR
jgi:4-hydroxy-3-polyprenylbenzoate decarboxylase